MIFLFNMGVPMIMPTMYFMVLALIPIVLIEAWYVSKTLRIGFSRTIGRLAIANMLSTLVGLPFTWLILFGIQMITGAFAYGTAGFAGKILAVTLLAPWLPPFGPEEFWMFHSAALFLLIPFFFATWLIEYVTVRNRFAIEVTQIDSTTDTSAAERKVLRAIRNANLLSYGLIALLLILSLVLISILR